MNPLYRSPYYELMIALFALLFIANLASWTTASADTGVTATVRFNNDNLATTPQPAPVGGSYDFGDLSIIPLEDGKTLFVERYILDPEHGVSIWKYKLDDAYWFVTGKGVIWGENAVGLEPMAETGLQALSIYLTQ
jgi:hypothetical protein